MPRGSTAYVNPITHVPTRPKQTPTAFGQDRARTGKYATHDYASQQPMYPMYGMSTEYMQMPTYVPPQFPAAQQFQMPMYMPHMPRPPINAQYQYTHASGGSHVSGAHKLETANSHAHLPRISHGQGQLPYAMPIPPPMQMPMNYGMQSQGYYGMQKITGRQQPYAASFDAGALDYHPSFQSTTRGASKRNAQENYATHQDYTMSTQQSAFRPPNPASIHRQTFSRPTTGRQRYEVRPPFYLHTEGTLEAPRKRRPVTPSEPPRNSLSTEERYQLCKLPSAASVMTGYTPYSYQDYLNMKSRDEQMLLPKGLGPNDTDQWKIEVFKTQQTEKRARIAAYIAQLKQKEMQRPRSKSGQRRSRDVRHANPEKSIIDKEMEKMQQEMSSKEENKEEAVEKKAQIAGMAGTNNAPNENPDAPEDGNAQAKQEKQEKPDKQTQRPAPQKPVIHHRKESKIPKRVSIIE